MRINGSARIGQYAAGEELGLLPMLNEEESFMGVADFE